MEAHMTGQPERLRQVLARTLTEAGFWSFPHMDFCVRTRQNIRDVIGWRRHEDGSLRYALYFGIWVPELEHTLPQHKVDEATDIHNTELMHDLSPALSDQLTYWWREDCSTVQQEVWLEQQLRSVALPYFDTFASVGDVAEMVFYDPRYHNTALEHRLLSNPHAALFNYDIGQVCEQVDTALKPLQKLAPAFHYSSGYFWRRRGEVFDVIVPRYLADWRFVQVRTMVWHPALDGVEHVPDALPEGFSQVAWRSFSDKGTESSQALPAFLGSSRYEHLSLESLLEGLRSYGLAWLEGINTRQDVLAAVRPEFKKFYPG